jgi:phosphate:Na+ symporter
MISIAVAHTLFNVINSAMFLPFAGALEKLVILMIKPRPGEVIEQAVVLEKHLLDTPFLALQQAKREIVRMAYEARKALEYAIGGLMSDDMGGISNTRKVEDVIDDFQNEITSYLVALSQRQLDDEVSAELPVLLHMVNDLERVGDHAVNIAELAERKIEQKIAFSDVAKEESEAIFTEVYAMFERIIRALEDNDAQAAHQSLNNENVLNRMQIKLRRNHVQRMTDRACSAPSGLIFIDLVDNIEKIGDHLTNVAQSVIGGVQWAGVERNMLSGEFKATDTE